MEKTNGLKRSETWSKIYDIVKTLPREKVSGDAPDASSVTTSIEQLFLKLLAINDVVKSLKDKEETAFDLWLKNFKHAERDLYWYNIDTLYCVEAMRDIYNTEIKPTL